MHEQRQSIAPPNAAEPGRGSRRAARPPHRPLCAATIATVLLGLATGCRSPAPPAAASAPEQTRPALATATAQLESARHDPRHRRAHLQAALEATAHADPAHARRLRAAVLCRLGRAPEAAGLLLPLPPDASFADRLAAAETLLACDQPERALPIAEAALRHAPSRRHAALTHRLAAHAALRLARFDRALHHARLTATRYLPPAEARSLARLRAWAARRAPLALERLPRRRVHAFSVHSEADPELTEAACRRLRELAPLYERLVPIDARDPRRTRPSRLYLLGPATWNRLGPAAARAHAFYRRDERAVFVLARFRPEIERTVAHEALHAWLHRVLPAAPAWLDEGLADLCATARLAPDAPPRFPPHPIRLRDLAIQLEGGEERELATLCRLDRPTLYARRCVSASWGWVHYLLLGEDGRYAPALFAYLAALRAGADPREAAQTLLDTSPPLDTTRWRDWILSLER